MPFRISYVGGDGNDLTLTVTLPQLDIAGTNPAQVRLSWPTNYPGFNLQRASAIRWFGAMVEPSRVACDDGQQLHRHASPRGQPATTNQEFFRLKQP